jgi:hypothetical protein
VSSRVCCLIDAKLGGMTLKIGLALVEEGFGEKAQEKERKSMFW